MEPNTNLVARESTEVVPCMLTIPTKFRFQVLLEVRMTTDWGKTKKAGWQSICFRSRYPDQSLPNKQDENSPPLASVKYRILVSGEASGPGHITHRDKDTYGK